MPFRGLRRSPDIGRPIIVGRKDEVRVSQRRQWDPHAQDPDPDPAAAVGNRDRCEGLGIGARAVALCGSMSSSAPTPAGDPRVLFRRIGSGRTLPRGGDCPWGELPLSRSEGVSGPVVSQSARGTGLGPQAQSSGEHRALAQIQPCPVWPGASTSRTGSSPSRRYPSLGGTAALGPFA